MAGFDSTRFRQVLGRYPTGVTVVTAPSASGPVGLTVGSFTSVSLDPPLVGWLPQKTSTTWPAVEAAGAFCVNILAADQGELCWRFAKDSDDKFAGVAWTPSPATGSPVLDGAVAWIDCAIEAVADAGDHWWVLGRVLDLDVLSDAVAMVFWQGRLGGFQGT